MCANLGLAASDGNCPVPVIDPVVADVAPTALPDMPAPDFSDLFGQRTPHHPVGAGIGAVQDDSGSTSPRRAVAGRAESRACSAARMVSRGVGMATLRSVLAKLMLAGYIASKT